MSYLDTMRESHESEAAMAKSTHIEGGSAGHQLRERFLSGEGRSRTEEALLELLLTYANPRMDVAPLACTLLERFYDLAGVLAAEPAEMLGVTGLNENSTVLLKAVDYIRRYLGSDLTEESKGHPVKNGQMSLFDFSSAISAASVEQPERKVSKRAEQRESARPARPRSELFANAALKETIELLPQAPLTESMEEMKQYLRGALHFSAEQTRVRNAEYITKRMFPSGQPDRALLLFARQYAGRQELRDVCFYRLCTAEPLVYALTDDLLVPEIGAGYLDRDRVRDYLTHRNPTSRSIRDTLRAIGAVYTAAGIARSDDNGWHIAYRDVLLPSIAFVLHSEFPTPGMYDIAKLEQNCAVRALLWNPDRILPTLYEMRNRGILGKVSEIDSVRQFTTRMTLEQAVEVLAAEGSRE